MCDKQLNAYVSKASVAQLKRLYKPISVNMPPTLNTSPCGIQCWWHVHFEVALQNLSLNASIDYLGKVTQWLGDSKPVLLGAAKYVIVLLKKKY